MFESIGNDRLRSIRSSPNRVANSPTPPGMNELNSMNHKKSNPLYDIIRKAHEQNWCVTPYCTTCGSREYRNAIKELSGPLGGGLADALADIDLQEISLLPNWQDALLVAIMDLPISQQVDGVLEAWLPKMSDHVAFADLILYKIVHYMRKDNVMRNNWIERCIDIAINSRNFSLIESLLLVLRREAWNYRKLIAIAKEYSYSSAQMDRALRNSCKLRAMESV